MKWEDYSCFDTTWEPENHIPAHLRTEYEHPSLTCELIQSASDKFLYCIKGRLNQRCGGHFYVDLDHTHFRFFFGSQETSKLCLKDDFRKFILPPDWDIFYYSEEGEGRKIDFPVKISTNLKWSKKHFTKTDNEKLVPAKRCPFESWKVELSTIRI